MIRLPLILRISGSATIVALAAWLLDWRALEGALKTLGIGSFVLAIALSIASYVPLALRWGLLLPHRDGPSGSIVVALRANIWNAFTPANIGGDAYRLVAHARSGGSAAAAMAALVRERLLGLLVYLAGYCGSWAWWFSGSTGGACPWSKVDVTHGGGLFMIAAAVTGSIALILLAAIAWTMHMGMIHTEGPRSESTWSIRGILNSISAPIPLLHLITILLLSVAGLALWVSAVGVIAADMGSQVPLPALAAIVILIELARLLPVSLQGIGVREGAFAVCFGWIGAGEESGFVLGGISYLALSLAMIIVGSIGWLIGEKKL
jgi:glycosyltransferase 2 family protein